MPENFTISPVLVSPLMSGKRTRNQGDSLPARLSKTRCSYCWQMPSQLLRGLRRANSNSSGTTPSFCTPPQIEETTKMGTPLKVFKIVLKSAPDHGALGDLDSSKLGGRAPNIMAS